MWLTVGLCRGPFFHLECEIPLTKAEIIDKVRMALMGAGILQVGYSRHSFRIRAATVAAQVGLPDSVIQVLGYWSSPAFLHYIRTSK